MTEMQCKIMCAKKCLQQCNVNNLTPTFSKNGLCPSHILVVCLNVAYFVFELVLCWVFPEFFPHWGFYLWFFPWRVLGSTLLNNVLYYAPSGTHILLLFHLGPFCISLLSILFVMHCALLYIEAHHTQNKRAHNLNNHFCGQRSCMRGGRS